MANTASVDELYLRSLCTLDQHKSLEARITPGIPEHSTEPKTYQLHKQHHLAPKFLPLRLVCFLGDDETRV